MGGVHGIYQIIGGCLQNFKKKIINKLEVKVESVSYKFGQLLITFVLVDFAWIFFRAEGIRPALCIIFRMFTKWNPWVLFDQSLYNLGLNVTEVHVLAISMVALLLVDWIKYKKGKGIEVFLEEQCLWFRWLTILATIFGIIIYGVYGPDFSASAFIYFQF